MAHGPRRHRPRRLPTPRADARLIVPHVKTFLRDDVPRILGASPDAPEPQWHLYFRCEWREWFEHRRAEAHERDDLSLLPYLPTQGKRHLVKQGVTTLAE